MLIDPTSIRNWTHEGCRFETWGKTDSRCWIVSCNGINSGERETINLGFSLGSSIEHGREYDQDRVWYRVAGLEERERLGRKEEGKQVDWTNESGRRSLAECWISFPQHVSTIQVVRRQMKSERRAGGWRKLRGGRKTGEGRVGRRIRLVVFGWEEQGIMFFRDMGATGWRHDDERGDGWKRGGGTSSGVDR
jgi:hypothetical protein